MLHIGVVCGQMRLARLIVQHGREEDERAHSSGRLRELLGGGSEDALADVKVQSVLGGKQ